MKSLVTNVLRFKTSLERLDSLVPVEDKLRDDDEQTPRTAAQILDWSIEGVRGRHGTSDTGSAPARRQRHSSED